LSEKNQRLDAEKLIKQYYFTHPEKILYPEQNLTKIDLAVYYYKMHALILPHLVNRPLSVVRCPDGYNQICFYQKHFDTRQIQHLNTILIQEKNQKNYYFYLNNIFGLMELVQWDVLEIHPWGCCIDRLDQPDRIIFDLDPDQDVSWQAMIDAIFLIKKLLKQINLKSFIKTTGGKGLHIVIPIEPKYTWDQVKSFAKTFAQSVVALKPDSYTANLSKIKRSGKIFIDYLRNQRGATAIAPYAMRAKKNAPISMPVSLKTLNDIKSDTFTCTDVLSKMLKLSSNPWKNFFKLKQKLHLDF
jgi:bifunctional non-homologous end joining protein LigD